MKKALLFIALIFSIGMVQAQDIAEFETYDTGTIGYLNNPADGEFQDVGIRLPTDYDPGYMSWQGWSISSTTDTQTPGFTNQYSSMSGGGYNGSSNYAVSYFYGGSTNLILEQATPNGFYINNNAYAYYSMLNGDTFAKKFGGETGDDPDFFLLTITGTNGDVTLDESVEFYLADYRFADNTQDYILTEWTYVDLTSLGAADQLIFTLSSSDSSDEFGMNTPAYFCMDDFTSTLLVSTEDARLDWTLNISPNPASDRINLEWPIVGGGAYAIFNAQGQRVQAGTLTAGSNQLDVNQLASGTYTVRYTDGQLWNASRFVKL